MKKQIFPSDDYFGDAIIKRVLCSKKPTGKIGNILYEEPEEFWYLTIIDPEKLVENELKEFQEDESNFEIKNYSKDCFHVDQSSQKLYLFLEENVRKDSYLEDLNSYKGSNKNIVEGCSFGYWEDARLFSTTNETDFAEDGNTYSKGEAEFTKENFIPWFQEKMQWFGKWFEGPDINEQVCERKQVRLAFYIEGLSKYNDHEEHYHPWDAPDLESTDFDRIEEYLLNLLKYLNDTGVITQNA